MCRFSDEKLQSFYDDFQDHVEEEEAYRKKEDARWKQVMALTKANMAATEANTEAMDRQVLATAGLASAWRDLIGTKRVLGAAGKLAIFLGIPTGLAGVAHWLDWFKWFKH